jgi:hypothetical protein
VQLRDRCRLAPLGRGFLSLAFVTVFIVLISQHPLGFSHGTEEKAGYDADTRRMARSC